MANEVSDRTSYSTPRVADKAALRRILEDQDRQTGFVLDAKATAKQARQLMIEQGIRPEDNEFSCEIRRIREGL
jgi:hypothetical protein